MTAVTTSPRPAVPPMRFVILGLSITSSWGNGHATTYRALVQALHARGHDVLFLERDVEWYASHRDLPDPSYCRVALYASLDELDASHRLDVARADCIIVGSYVPEGVAVGEWVLAHAEGVTAFYDIDTPVTLADLESGRSTYLTRDLMRRYDVYLTFTGGPVLGSLETAYGVQRARPLYCSFDPATYYPLDTAPRWDLGYMGTYSADRQPTLDRLLLAPAQSMPAERFIVAGPSYPADIAWPQNVERIEHLPPSRHRAFYTSQRFTLNVTRAAMIRLGYSPSVRLFEAAACATPIVSDAWDGLDTFFVPGREILVADTADDVCRQLRDLPDEARRALGQRAREKVLATHTPAHRAMELEQYVSEACGREVRTA